MEKLEGLFEQVKGMSESAKAAVEAAIREGVSAQELSKLLEAEGVSTVEAEVESALALLQQARGRAAAEAGELDDEQLAAVAGGGTGVCEGKATCDDQFKDLYWYPSDKRCTYQDSCDTLYGDLIKCDKDFVIDFTR